MGNAVQVNLNIYFSLILIIFSIVPIYNYCALRKRTASQNNLELIAIIMLLLTGGSIFFQLIDEAFTLNINQIQNVISLLLISSLILQGFMIRSFYTEKLPSNFTENLARKRNSALKKVPILLGLIGFTVWKEFGSLAVWKLHGVFIIFLLLTYKVKLKIDFSGRFLAVIFLLAFPVYSKAFDILNPVRLNELFFLSLIIALLMGSNLKWFRTKGASE